MSNVCGDSSLFYLTRRSQAHDRRQRMVQTKRSGLLRASTQGLYNLHHHMLHRRTTLHKPSLRARRSQGARRRRSLSRRAAPDSTALHRTFVPRLPHPADHPAQA